MIKSEKINEICCNEWHKSIKLQVKHIECEWYLTENDCIEKAMIIKQMSIMYQEVQMIETFYIPKESVFQC